MAIKDKDWSLLKRSPISSLYSFTSLYLMCFFIRVIIGPHQTKEIFLEDRKLEKDFYFPVQSTIHYFYNFMFDYSI